VWDLDWALEELAKLGTLPTDAYLMTIAEINIYLHHRSTHEVELSISSAWRTINFLGAFMADKFKNLDRYLPETKPRKKANEEKKKRLEDKLAKIL
jgi:hypothetical protein